jgi:hypothetical protein
MQSLLYHQRSCFFLKFLLAPAKSESTNDGSETSLSVQLPAPKQMQLEFRVKGQTVRLNLTRTDNNYKNNDNFTVLIGERGRITRWQTSNTSQVSSLLGGASRLLTNCLAGWSV